MCFLRVKFQSDLNPDLENKVCGKKPKTTIVMARNYALENSCSFLVYTNSALQVHRRLKRRSPWLKTTGCFVGSTKFVFWNDDTLACFETTIFLSMWTSRIIHLQEKLSCKKN